MDLQVVVLVTVSFAIISTASAGKPTQWPTLLYCLLEKGVQWLKIVKCLQQNAFSTEVPARLGARQQGVKTLIHCGPCLYGAGAYSD